MKSYGPTGPNTRKHKHKEHKENSSKEQTKFLKSRDKDRLLEKRAQAARRREGEDGHFALEAMRARRQWVAPSKKAHQPGMLYPAGHLLTLGRNKGQREHCLLLLAGKPCRAGPATQLLARVRMLSGPSTGGASRSHWVWVPSDPT